jgi:hypothetical protein
MGTGLLSFRTGVSELGALIRGFARLAEQNLKLRKLRGFPSGAKAEPFQSRSKVNVKTRYC